MKTKKRISKTRHLYSNVKCGVCGCRIDKEHLATMKPSDTRITLCRYCEV